MNRREVFGVRVIVAFIVSVSASLSTAPAAMAELYINEIFFDPGGQGGSDERDEFIELRGTPGMSLANYFLIFVENEDNLAHNGGAGLVENIFDLGARSMGSNGYLTMLQKNNLYSLIGTPAPGATNLVNTGTGQGWGNGTSSSVGHTGELGKLHIENSGFTAMLIHNVSGGVPTIGLDLDVGNDGLDVATGREGWEIIDAIGVFSEAGEAGLGRLYAPINFGPEITGQTIPVLDGGPTFAPRIEAGATYVGLGFEIEYIGRWGDSIGHSAADWHASNLTNNPLSGSQGVPDYRQSAEPHGVGVDQVVESSQGVSYGTSILASMGSTNLSLLDGDADLDGDVDGADFLTWQRNFGYGEGIIAGASVGAVRTHGDFNVNRTVDAGDLEVWRSNFGAAASLPSAVAPVPEPAAVALAVIALLGLLVQRRSQRD
jgi:hypothetical protein